MQNISETAQKATESLREAVAETLNKKRLLGQYAVMGKDGRPVKVPASDLPILKK